MNIIIIIMSVLLVGGMVYYLKKLRAEKSRDKDYLETMAHFFEGQLSVIPDSDNAKRISFQYRGYPCVYEDIELPGLQSGSALNVGYMKVKTQSPLSLSFTEKSRTQIRSNAQTLEEVTQSRWGTSKDKVQLPKSLENFEVYTNDPLRAERFINNPKVLKVFESYKNRDARGHPLLSMKVVEGTVVLEFHALGGLKPSILEIQHNVTAAEDYLQELIGVAEILKTLMGEKSS